MPVLFIFHGVKYTFHGVQYTFRVVKYTFHVVKYSFVALSSTFSMLFPMMFERLGFHFFTNHPTNATPTANSFSLL